MEKQKLVFRIFLILTLLIVLIPTIVMQILPWISYLAIYLIAYFFLWFLIPILILSTLGVYLILRKLEIEHRWAYVFWSIFLIHSLLALISTTLIRSIGVNLG